jgi:hypothetical protein
VPVDVRTIRGVELVKVGTWECVNGTWSITAAMLRAAVDAHRAGPVRKPVIKLGHEGPMRDAAPALGYVDGLRLADGGNTLVGDLVNVPAPVANLIPHAYPSRSIEAWMDYEAPDGTVWPFLITGLALLGATGPGCETLTSLQDVAGLYGVDVAAAQRGRPVLIAASAFRSDVAARAARARAVQVAAARRRRTNRALATTKHEGT